MQLIIALLAMILPLDCIVDTDNLLQTSYNKQRKPTQHFHVRCFAVKVIGGMAYGIACGMAYEGNISLELKAWVLHVNKYFTNIFHEFYEMQIKISNLCKI